MSQLFVSLPYCKKISDKNIGIELRLDLFQKIDLEEIKKFIQSSLSPVLLTLRKKSSGGKFVESEKKRETLIKELLALKPAFFDLEHDMDPAFLKKTLKSYPETKFILSSHHFDTLPDLEKIYESMKEYDAYSYKIAAMTLSTNDALKMLLFKKRDQKISVICMGEESKFARILAKIFGNLVNYACLEEKTAPGQLSLSELLLYQYDRLNEDTLIYGLIGDPVEKSRGHIYHNRVFQTKNLNSVYVKMKVKPEELEEFFSLALLIGLKGLSVTMPLKEKILPFLHKITLCSEKIGAINTLLFKNDTIIGTNTDGKGALDAIEKYTPVKGKKIALIGAGGACRALAFEAKARGATLFILNRTQEKAQSLAKEVEGRGCMLQEQISYDILINCTSLALPIDPDNIHAQTIVMDINYFPKETLFLQEAAKKNCHIIYGEEMFSNQAARQSAFWMGL